MNAVVVTFDCLPMRFLGAYGNLWVRTPHFDRLAAESFVFHQQIAARTVEFPGEPWWADRETDAATIGALSRAGVRTLWRGEARDRRRLPADRPFESRAVFLGEDRTLGSAGDTPWFQMVEDSLRLLPRLFRTVQSPWLLWLQSAGLPAPWTAPQDWALKYLEMEDDREPAQIAAILSRLSDPARSAEWTPAEWKFSRGLCAGYVSLIDAALGGLLDAIDRAPKDKAPLLIVLAGSGRVMSARTDVPEAYRPLLSEAVQAPLFVRLPDRKEGERRQELVQTTDLPATLADWFQAPVAHSVQGGQSWLPLLRHPGCWPREMAVTVSPSGAKSVRSRRSVLFAAPSIPVHQGEAVPPRLHLKPDDLWETLDVSNSAPEETANLLATLDAISPATPSAGRADLKSST